MRPDLKRTYLVCSPLAPVAHLSPLGNRRAGIKFDVNIRIGSKNDESKPGSDLEHVRRLVRQAKHFQS